ncbi:MAG: S41 family peptidase [Bacteroidota bacterium]
MMKTKYGAAILGKEQWSLDIISEDIAVMRLGTFAIWKWKDFDQKQWFADAFQQLDSLGIEKLAIDIRGNGGGLSDPANELLSYLISDSLKCDDLGKIYIRTTKLNPDLLPFMDLYVEGLKTGLPANMYQAAENDLYELFEPSQCTDIAPQENRFSGETLIFGNSSNVSATFTLLKKANQFGFATYVGQESGGNQQGINGGQYAFFHLPYSKFEVDIPLKYFAPKSERPDAGVQPKVPIQITQEDIAKGRDPYLNYLEKY